MIQKILQKMRTDAIGKASGTQSSYPPPSRLRKGGVEVGLLTLFYYCSPNANASCTAFIAVSIYFSSINTVTLISEVEICLMFTPQS